jgi:hypothetical protein
MALGTCIVFGACAGLIFQGFKLLPGAEAKYNETEPVEDDAFQKAVKAGSAAANVKIREFVEKEKIRWKERGEKHG